MYSRNRVKTFQYVLTPEITVSVHIELCDMKRYSQNQKLIHILHNSWAYNGRTIHKGVTFSDFSLDQVYYRIHLTPRSRPGYAKHFLKNLLRKQRQQITLKRVSQKYDFHEASISTHSSPSYVVPSRLNATPTKTGFTTTCDANKERFHDTNPWRTEHSQT